MTPPKPSALVVEDDVSICRLAARALRDEGFQCDTATDGAEALQKLEQKCYSAVITDLIMPRQHGHALAVKILQRPNPPLVVVLTAVTDPRITKDLIARGVDDVVYKPVEFRSFAAKVKALFERRTASPPEPSQTDDQPDRCGTVSAPDPADPAPHSATFERDLPPSPVSPVLFQIFEAAHAEMTDPPVLADILERDAELQSDVLRVANSKAFQRSGKPVHKLEWAVGLLGNQRVADLALAACATRIVRAWPQSPLDRDTAWQRAVAAAFVARCTARQAGALFPLCALLHSLGRFLLSGLWPKPYAALISSCRHGTQMLADMEHRAFSIHPGESAARIASHWEFPAEVSDLLSSAATLTPQHAHFAAGPDLVAPCLLQLCSALAPFCTGQWDPWDSIDLPCPQLLQQLLLTPVDDLISQVRAELLAINEMTMRPSGGETLDQPQCEVRYHSLVPAAADCLPELFKAMGLRPVPADPHCDDGPIMINAFGLTAGILSSRLQSTELPERRIILADAAHVDAAREFGVVLRVPCSFSMLASVCSHAASPSRRSGAPAPFASRNPAGESRRSPVNA